MNRKNLIPLVAAVAAGLYLPQAAFAQVRRPAAPPPAAEPVKDNRPPIPPGVPTNPGNVHLPTEGEVKLGRQTSVEVEKHYKIIASGPYHDRLQRVAAEVLRAMEREEIIADYKKTYRLPKREDRALRVPFEFTFKVVDAPKEVNAFSLAGGPIYVTTALMDYAPSDHELAGVLAHECAHVSYHHVEQLVKKQKKASAAQLWGMLAAVIAGVAGGGRALSSAVPVLAGAQLVSVATLTGYGRELEHEADRVAVVALARTSYHPGGMLTFMQKLARDDRLRGNPDLGIYQSHPFTNERVDALRKHMATAGFAADQAALRKVSSVFRVAAMPQRVQGRDVVELRLGGNLLFIVAAGDGERSAAERAQNMVRQLETLLADNLSASDVRQSADGSVLTLKGIPVFRVLPEDAAVAGSAAEATERAKNEILRALLQEKLDTQY